MHRTFCGGLRLSLEPLGVEALVSVRAAVNPLPPQLPIELIERITDFLFELHLPIAVSTEDAPLHCLKPAWKDVSGFMAASAEFHHMGFRRWLRVTTVKEQGDWTIVSQNSHLISEIRCLDNTLLDPQNQEILSKLSHLYSAVIDAHNDVWQDSNNQFSYRDIIATLPPSLRQLEITHAHRPDDKIIAMVKTYCPQLEQLRLGRCTMFNRIPACDFWASFPHDHDTYMADSGTDAYADRLGKELSPLTNLRALRMGLYFVSPSIVFAHRLYHKRGLPAPEAIDWQAAIQHINAIAPDELVPVLHEHDSEPGEEFDCPQCIEATADISRTAEKSASEILRSHVPSLTKVQWMGWLTPGHLGVHNYEFPSGFDV